MDDSWGEQDRESESGKKESKTAWKETRRGGKISARSESKRLGDKSTWERK